jgi:serine/threonine protein kinase
MSFCINPNCPKPDDPLNAGQNICRQCGSDLLINQRYQAIKPIGTGGFGRTYEIDDDGTRKVLKVLHQTSAKAVSLFQREAQVLKRLEHPGIPKVEPDGYFTFPNKNSRKPLHCLVMAKIEGQNLLDWLESQESQEISAEQVADWLKQLVEILDHLHQQHYFHRDIKPENIILQPNGQLVLIDFGGVRPVTNTFLAKIVEGREVTKLITKGYTPPEQERGQSVPLSDFYALGRTFVHLLTGVSPTELPQDYGQLIWRDKVTSIPDKLADLIDDMMDANSLGRPQSTQAILQRLADSGLVKAAELPVVPPTGQKVISQQNKKSQWPKDLPKTRKTALVLGMASVATVIALTLRNFTLPRPQSPITGVNSRTFAPPQRPSPTPPGNFSLYRNLKTNSTEADPVTSVAFSPDGQTLARGSFDQAITLLNWRTGQILTTFSEASSKVWSVAISPDGQLLASGHWEDNTIKLWNLRTGSLLRTFKGHSDEVRSVAFSPDGQLLASGSHDSKIKLWRVSTGELLHTFSGHTDHVTSVAFNPDGKTLASACDDKTIKLWSLDAMKLVRTLKGHSGQVLSVAFSPDGETLVSGSGEDPNIGSVDNTIKLWNPRTGELRRTLTGHTSWVWSLAISPDGQVLASGSYDNSIRLWNLRDGQLLQTLTGHSNRVYTVAFSPDGQTLASGSDDKSIKIWTASP